MILLNETGIKQVFDHWGMDFVIDKNTAFYSDVVAEGRFTTSVFSYPGFSRFKDFKQVIQFFGNDKKYVLHRSHALGDVLMMKAFIDHIRSLGYDNVFGSTDFGRFEYLMPHIPRAGETNVVTLNLDGTLELDHNPEHSFSLMHRIDIFAKVFGIQVKDFTWNMNIPGKSKIDVENKALIQVGGSTPIKTLNPAFVKALINTLEKELGIEVVLFGKPNGNDFKGRFIDKTLTFEELYNLINECRFLITMDSAPLWVSHFTKTPTILLHGPTRVQERLSMHPMFPELTGSIDLASLVGCSPCFEKQHNCKVGVDCMQSLPVRQLTEQLIEQVTKIEGN